MARRKKNDPGCSNNDNATNSCYKFVTQDGHDLAAKYIMICESYYSAKPPGEHSKKYVEGWGDGISDTDAAASNDDGT